MTPTGGLGVGVRNALAFDRSGFEPVLALRAAAGVVVPFAIGTAVGQPAEGAIVAAGALPAGIASFGGGLRSRSRMIIATTTGMALSTFVGGLVAGHLVPTMGALLIWGFAAGITVVLGRDATVIGTQAVMGLVVFGRFPGSVSSSAVHAGWVFVGGAFQGLLVAVFRPPKRFAAERRILAAAYVELAEFARDPQRPAITAIGEAAMAGPLVGRRMPSEDVELLRGLADEAERVRLELQGLVTVLALPGVAEVRAAAAAWLTRASQAIRTGASAMDEDDRLAEAVDLLRRRREEAPLGRGGTEARYAAARATALLGQLRAIDRLASALAGVRRLVLPGREGIPIAVMLPQRAADSARRVFAAIGDPQSSAFRHAIRLAVVLPVAEGLSHVVPWERGYWVTLTALVVLKPDYAATLQRGIARVAGTALGVLLVGLLVVGVDPSGGLLSILLAGATWLAYSSFGASYALYSFAVTAVVVLLLASIGGNELSTVADRGLDTLLGGAVALAGYLVWPTWEGETLTTELDRLLEALAAYAEVLLTAYADPDSVKREQVATAATNARRARIAAQSSLSRAVAEPARAGSDTDSAAGVLAAARRIVIALHALRATVDDASEHVGVPEVAGIRDCIVTALRSLAAHQSFEPTTLRELQQALELEDPQPVDPASLHARRRALVAAHLDPLVDSVDTLGHVLSAGQGSAAA